MRSFPVLLLLLANHVPAGAAVERVEGRWFSQKCRVEWTPPPVPSGVAGTVRAELDRVAGLLGSGPDQTIGAVNRASGGEWAPVPTELVLLMARCREIHRRTDGKFDPSYGASTHLWNFDSRDNVQIPRTDALRRAVSLTRFDLVGIRLQPPAVQLPRDMQLDFDALAPGYAADRIGEILVAHGVPAARIEFGGVHKAWGGDPNAVVEIRDPYKPLRTVARIPSDGVAVAVRGIHQRHILHQGEKYHDVIDPRTGWPAAGSGLVVVVAGHAEFAQAMAGALMCEEPESNIMAMRRFPGVEALCIGIDGRVKATPGLQSRLVDPPFTLP